MQQQLCQQARRKSHQTLSKELREEQMLIGQEG